MMPGFRGGMNPKQLSRMMKQLGIDVRDIDDVQQVVIRTPTKEYVFKDAAVSVMKAQGQTTYQVVGEPEVRNLGEGGAPAEAADERAPAAAPGPKFTDDDVKLVAQQAGVSAAEARKALEECDGQPADAILKLVGDG